MKAKPILFSAPMVQAILEQRKTQTRRVLRPQPVIDVDGMWHWKDCQWMDGGIGFPASGVEDYAPYHPGNILWVKETWGVGTRPDPFDGWADGIEFKADEAFLQGDFDDLDLYHRNDERLLDVFEKNEGRGWRPSIFMPKAAARIFLRVKDVRVEQVQDISGIDASREGVTIQKESGYRGRFKDTDIAVAYAQSMQMKAVSAFRELWDKLNAKRGHSWASNPWVWVVEFEPFDRPQGWPEGAS